MSSEVTQQVIDQTFEILEGVTQKRLNLTANFRSYLTKNDCPLSHNLE